MYTRLDTYRLHADGRMERRESETPTIVNPPPVSVSIRRGTDAHVATKLLRRLADEIEQQGATP
jgi:hypothetical protein